MKNTLSVSWIDLVRILIVKEWSSANGGSKARMKILFNQKGRCSD